nr:hypothetical protein [Tanacetum cinerariifolium]
VASEKTNSGGNTEILQTDEEQGKDVDDHVVMDEDQAKLDPGESLGALAGSGPEPTHDEFIADLYPKSQASQSSAWKKSDTRDAPLSFSKQQFDPHAEQPVEDIPILDTANISNSEDTDSAHLLKIKQMPKWLKPIPNDERPATPEPAWVIPTSHIPDDVNKWANALATTYQASTENSLLKKTRDMWTFMHSKESGQALSISNMKAARYLDFGLELLVHEHMWINKEQEYSCNLAGESGYAFDCTCN